MQLGDRRSNEQSANLWLEERLSKELEDALRDVSQADNTPGGLEKIALALVTRIAVIRRMQLSARREIKVSVAEDQSAYGNLNS